MKTLILTLLLCTSSFAMDISGGVTDYLPTLGHIQEDYDIERSPSGWYARIRVDEPSTANHPPYVVAMTYTGCTVRGEVDMDIHGLEASYMLELPTNITPYIGAGPTIYYMRRDFHNTVHNDFPWGVHGIAGMRGNMGFIGIDAGYVYTWSKTSTWGGSEYDLGCSRWYAGVTIGG